MRPLSYAELSALFTSLDIRFDSRDRIIVMVDNHKRGVGYVTRAWMKALAFELTGSEDYLSFISSEDRKKAIDEVAAVLRTQGKSVIDYQI